LPLVGLGTSQFPSDEVLKDAINCALETGYRHFDTAFSFENEVLIGEVIDGWIQSGKIKRSDLFITTKLPFIGNQAKKVEFFLDLSLQGLKLEYVDLFLIEFPVGFRSEEDGEQFVDEDGSGMLDLNTDIISLWKAMESQVDAGRCKSIGLSNFNSKQIERIVQAARIKPSCLQVELHAYFQQKPLRELCSKHDISVCAYGPLGSKGRLEFSNECGTPPPPIPPVLEDPLVLKLSKAHAKTPAQILLRHLIQQNIAVIPKSASPRRIKENFEVLNFELTDREIEQLNSLDNNFRSFKFDFFPWIEEHPEYPFHILY